MAIIKYSDLVNPVQKQQVNKIIKYSDAVKSMGTTTTSTPTISKKQQELDIISKFNPTTADLMREQSELSNKLYLYSNTSPDERKKAMNRYKEVSSLLKNQSVSVDSSNKIVLGDYLLGENVNNYLYGSTGETEDQLIKRLRSQNVSETSIDEIRKQISPDYRDRLAKFEQIKKNARNGEYYWNQYGTVTKAIEEDLAKIGFNDEAKYNEVVAEAKKYADAHNGLDKTDVAIAKAANAVESIGGGIRRGYQNAVDDRNIGHLIEIGDIEGAVKYANEHPSQGTTLNDLLKQYGYEPLKEEGLYSDRDKNIGDQNVKEGLAGTIEGTTNLIGQIGSQYTNPLTMGTAAAGAAIGGLIGRAPGAAKGLKIGANIGAAFEGGTLEAGGSFRELIEMGIEPNLARNIALGVGIVNGTLEFVQLDTLAKSLEKTAMSDSTKFLIKEYVLDVLSNTLQERMQERVSVAGEGLGTYLMSKESSKKLKDIISFTLKYSYSDASNARVNEIGRTSFISFAILGLPGAVLNVNSIEQKNAYLHDASYLIELGMREEDVKALLNEYTGNEKYTDDIYDEAKQNVDNKDRIEIQKEIDEIDRLKEDLQQRNETEIQEYQQSKGTDTEVQLTSNQAQIAALQEQLSKTSNNKEIAELTAQMKELEAKLDAQNQPSIETTKNSTKLPMVEPTTLEESAKLFNIDTNSNEYKFAKAIKDRLGVEVILKNNLTNPNGQKVNGAYRYDPFGKTIYLNVNSGQTVQRLLTHELTHALEGTKEMNELQDFVIRYFKFTNNDLWEKAFQNLSDIYYPAYGQRADFDAKVRSEATAEILGNLLNDQNFLNNLAYSKPSVFKRLYAKINELIAKAVGSEKAFLRAVKAKMEIAWSEALEHKKELSYNNSNSKADVSFSSKNNPYGHVKEFLKLSKKEQSDAHRAISPVAAEMGAKGKRYGSATDVNGHTYDFEIFSDMTYRVTNVMKYSDEVEVIINETNSKRDSNDTLASTVNERSNNEVAINTNRNRRTGKEDVEVSSRKQKQQGNNGYRLPNTEQRKNNKELKNSSFSLPLEKIQGLEDYSRDKIKSITADYIKTALLYSDIDADIEGMEIIGSRNRGTAKKNSDLDIVVELSGDDLREDDLFNVLNDTEEPLEINGIKVDINPIVSYRSGTLKDFMKRSEEYDKQVIAKKALPTDSKTKDSEGRTLSKEQQEFFKDSKVRTSDGKLMVMYHGTPNGDFNSFRDGSYFTPKKEYASRYLNEGASSISYGKVKTNPKIFEVYLNITNPFDITNDKAKKIFIEEYIKGNNSLFFNPHNSTEEYYEQFKDAKGVEWLEGGDLSEWLKKKHPEYDGLIIDEGGDGGYGMEYEWRGLSYMPFNANQIKNVDNTNPTIESSDTRYSLPIEHQKDNKGRVLSKSQEKYFKDSKIRDENGNLMTVYHTTVNDVIQFNEFNPRKVPGYKFGDKTVNFYTDSKTMSGSYAHNKYEMADTKKINTEKQALDFVESVVGQPVKLITGKTPQLNRTYYSIVRQDFDESKILDKLPDYDEEFATAFSKEELFKNLKSDIQNHYGNKAKIQYEGYLNITNPYVADAQEENWDHIPSGFNEMDYRYAKQISEADKEELIELAKESLKNSEENYTRFKNLLKEQTQLRDKYGFYFAKAVEDNDGSYFKTKEGKKDFERAKEIRRLLNDVYNNNSNPTFEDDYFREKAKPIIERINNEFNMNFSDMEMYMMAKGEFTDETIKRVFSTYSTTNDIIKKVLKKNENGANYDGVIIRDVLDYGMDGAEFDDNAANDVYVTFNSNQFKAIDNKRPTDDADIRYSQSLEPEKTLMAIHNLSEDKLKGILELGGFPAPSIAITNPDKVNHSGYGNISVLFNKDTIDPSDGQNEVYDRDVWSPRFPTVEYEIIDEEIDKTAKKLGIEDWKMRDYAEDNSKPEYLVDRLTRDEAVVDTYILDNNIDYETAYKEPHIKRSYNDKPNVRKWIKDNHITIDKLANNKDLKNKYLDLIGIDKDGELYFALSDGLDFYAGKDKFKTPWIKSLDNDLKVITGEMEAKPEIDEWQTEKNKREAAIKNGIEEYLKEQIKSIYGNKGIRNDKEYLTDSGKRRTFWQLHDEYNLENIVKNITKQNTVSSETTFLGEGFGNLQAKLSNQYNSIDEIKQNENKIMPSEEAAKIVQPLIDELNSEMEELAELYGEKFDAFWDMDSINYQMQEFSRLRNLTSDGFYKIAEKYNPTLANANIELVNRIIETMNKIKDIPTDYFEAKPQRAVGFDEVEAVVIPKNTDEAFKKQLQDAGLNVVEYDPDVQGDRQRVISQFENLKFSQDTDGAFEEFLEKAVRPINKNKQESTFKDIQKKVLNPLEISKLKKEDASTTPYLPNVKRNKNYDGKSKFASNIENKVGMLSDESKQLILSDDDVNYYDKVTNKDSLEEAYERLNKNGSFETTRWFNKKDRYDSTDVAEGWILLKQYQDAANNATNETDKYQANQSMVEVAKKLREIGTTAGQTVQAFNILARMTPEGMVYYAQSELDEAYKRMVVNKTKDWINAHQKDFELTPSEVQFIIDTMLEVSEMEDGYEKKVKLAEIQKLITDKIPPEKGDSLKAWMRISMLFNPKTQVRNVAGNAIIAPVNYFGDLFSSYVDKLISKKSGVRTIGAPNVKAILKGFKRGAYEATNDYKKGINTKDMEGNRFEIKEGKSFSNKTLIGRALNRTEELLNYVMDIGDRVFSESSFENSLRNQMILNNTNEITQDMIDIAHEEALSRTWNDNNNYTKLVLNIRNSLNKFGVKGYGLGDVLIPFAKTPANLTKAIVDYSPAGLVNALVEGNNLKKSLSNCQFTAQMQHKFVQDLGKAVAGTALYVLAYAMAKAGMATGKSDDDKDVADFLKNTLGISSYSIKIGDKSFTYDWAQPIAAPLAIMTNIVNSSGNDKALLEGITSSLNSAGSILLEQSFLQSINDVLNDNDGLFSGIETELLELPARAIPTLVKQIADMTDGTARQTYEYKQPIKSAVNYAKSKLPGLSKTLAPKVDTMGREIKKYGGKNNLFNVFLNPANVNTENLSTAADEIYRLYKATGDETIMPRVAPYYVNKNGEKKVFTPQQRAEYQKISGSIVEKEVNKLLQSSDYRNLSNTDKVDVVNNIVNYAYNVAQSEVLGTEISSTYKKAYYFSEVGDLSDWYIYKSQNFTADKDSNGKTISGSKKKKVIDYLNSTDMTAVQKAIILKFDGYAVKDYDQQIINYVNSTVKNYDDKITLLELLGYTVKDGKVYVK